MAERIKDFVGWEFTLKSVLQDTSSKRVRAGSRIGGSRRGKSNDNKKVLFRDNPDNVTLIRQSDSLQFSIGDCLSVQNKESVDYYLVKKIALQQRDYVELIGILLKTKARVLKELEVAASMFNYETKSEDSEVFLTPEMHKLSVKDIIARIEVLDAAKKSICTPKGPFFCRRACDISYTSQEFVWSELLEDLFANEDKFRPFMSDLLYNKNSEYQRYVQRNTISKPQLKRVLEQDLDPRKRVKLEKIDTLLNAERPRRAKKEKSRSPSKKITASLSKRLSASPYKTTRSQRPTKSSLRSSSTRSPSRPSSSSKSATEKENDKDFEKKNEKEEEYFDTDEDDEESDQESDDSDSFTGTSDSSSSFEEVVDPENSDDDIMEIVRRPRRPQKSGNNAKSNHKSSTKSRNNTPSIPKRQIDIQDTSAENPFEFQNAKEQLHTSALLASLPCREEEFAQLYLTLESLISQQVGSCIYISGTPGTGKTATIRQVINELHARKNRLREMEKLKQEIEDLKNNNDEASRKVSQEMETKLLEIMQTEDGKELEHLGEFDFVEINGLKLISPNSCYEKLWAKISGKHVSAKTAKNLIENYLSEEDPDIVKKRKPLIVLMDEIDQVITKSQSIMYNFFNWPTYENSKLIVIAIANTMDLPERVLTNKISSRLGLSRLLFPGYTHEELAIIIEKRLSNMNKKMDSNDKTLKFERSAIEFASRKVASVSGDARRALSICRRAVEIAELEYSGKKTAEVYYVRISHIIKSIQETTHSPVSVYVMNFTLMSKIFLAAILRRQKFTGLYENDVGDLIEEMSRIIQMEFSNLNDLNCKSVLLGGNNVFDVYQNSGLINDQWVLGLNMITCQLVESGIITQVRTKGSNRLVKLCVAEDEIHNALRKEKVFQRILG